jgi:hypothetical protein
MLHGNRALAIRQVHMRGKDLGVNSGRGVYIIQ